MSLTASDCWICPFTVGHWRTNLCIWPAWLEATLVCMQAPSRSTLGMWSPGMVTCAEASELTVATHHIPVGVALHRQSSTGCPVRIALTGAISRSGVSRPPSHHTSGYILVHMSGCRGGKKEMIVHGGVGYMANTSLNPAKHNVRLKRVAVAGFLDNQLLLATRHIAPHEEIISPYNNTDLRCT
jgi:hypothetical protein